MIRGIRLLHTIAALSCLGIFGIFAWSVENISEGGRGITSSLLFFAYILFLLACNAEIVATDETLREDYNTTKKLYLVAKSNPNVKKIDIFEHEHNQRNIYVVFSVVIIAAIFFAFTIHATMVKSIMMSFFLSVGFFFLILTSIIVTWNVMGIRKLNKIKEALNQSSKTA